MLVDRMHLELTQLMGVHTFMSTQRVNQLKGRVRAAPPIHNLHTMWRQHAMLIDRGEHVLSPAAAPASAAFCACVRLCVLPRYLDASVQ